MTAQSIDFSKMESLKPRNNGQAGMSGGIAWKPIFDSEIPLSIGAVAVSQKTQMSFG